MAMARRVASTIGSHVLHEYYDPYTGRGMGASEFAWSTLALEIVDPEISISQPMIENRRPSPSPR